MKIKIKTDTKPLNTEDKIIIITGTTILIFILLFYSHFLYHIIKPYSEYKPINFNYNDTILIIAPHPDDEAAIAGSIFFEHNTSNIYIVYLTTGSFFNNKKLYSLYANERIKEAKKAMKKIGVKEKNLYFLNYKDQELLYEPENIIKAKEKIKLIIKEKNPKIILLPSYEGGHCIHDLTNIMLNKIKKEIEKENIKNKTKTQNNIIYYEVAEYNEYYNLNTPRKTLSKILQTYNINLNYPALFLPEKTQKINITKKYYYNSSKKNLKQKRQLLKQYTTQNIEGSLKKKFYYTEFLRILPEYNYSNPPYNIKESISYYTCIIKNFYNKKKCKKYSVCKITFEEFKKNIKQAGLI